MKMFLMGMMATIFLSISASAQTNVFAAGLSYNTNQSASGTAMWAHQISGGTYTFTVLDALPTTSQPVTVTTNIGSGIAQKLFEVNNVSVWMPTSAGISWTGDNTGWQWTGGALINIKFKGYYIMPNIRFLKSSVSNGTGYQPIIGIMFGAGS